VVVFLEQRDIVGNVPPTTTETRRSVGEVVHALREGVLRPAERTCEGDQRPFRRWGAAARLERVDAFVKESLG
jgi:hypothetical protein